MPIPERASGWPGRTLSAAASVLFAMLATGCATHPVNPHVSRDYTLDDLQFLARAMDGGTATREAMWREVQAAPHSQDNSLRLALLQSVPDHSGYDPVAAQRNLRALLAQGPPEYLVVLARVRLDDLKSSTQCLGETQDLRRRLSQVVEIERQIDNRGH